MLARMPSRLLTEWMVFAKLEPFGERQADLRAAIVAATIANANRGKNQKAFKVEDFMPRLGDDEEEREPDWESMLERVRGLNAAFGGEDHSE
jgi:hypothetical protein